MTRDTEAILVGRNPSKNQTFSGVSETIQSFWEKHTSFTKYSFFFFSFAAKYPGKLNPNKVIKPICRIVKSTVVNVKLIPHLKQ